MPPPGQRASPWPGLDQPPRAAATIYPGMLSPGPGSRAPPQGPGSDALLPPPEATTRYLVSPAGNNLLPPPRVGWVVQHRSGVEHSRRPLLPPYSLDSRPRPRHHPQKGRTGLSRPDRGRRRPSPRSHRVPPPSKLSRGRRPQPNTTAGQAPPCLSSCRSRLLRAAVHEMPVRPEVPVGISAVQKQRRKRQKKPRDLICFRKKCKTKKEHESHASRTHSTSWLLVLKAQVVAATITSGLLLDTIMGCCLCALYI
ncbi:proline-rich receptor-like protein kinase PERK2 isoform X2 [Triticum urartu]|uniref:proline-rich receptor-like protein kinase PERK2 isoform X2 n=1 Tax=Triticum urartu TaxID=4572 RepID=UPI002043395C|nr:proline-rich receptor-like protein kinase PERK2 isoform X2 [Triticum urartu]